MRRSNDFYETNKLAVTELLKYLPLKLGNVLEPTAGRNAITLPLIASSRCTSVRTNDISHSYNHPCHLDMTQDLSWETIYKIYCPFDWIITNPPFSVAYNILTRAVDLAQQGVAFLLRLSFLEPTIEREEFLCEHPPSQLIILPRYSFTGDGKTDSVTCAWMIWEKNQTGSIRVSHR